MLLAASAVLILSGCSATDAGSDAAGLSWDVEQVEADVREDYEAKLTDEYPEARVRSVRCVEENELRLACAARLSGANIERTQLDVVGAPDDFIWEEANQTDAASPACRPAQLASPSS
jgi:hypothetical protein